MIAPTGREEPISRIEYVERKAEALRYGDFGNIKYEARLAETKN